VNGQGRLGRVPVAGYSVTEVTGAIQ
jgi:hypothetical protein